MKKIICVLLVLAGFSAFAVNPFCNKPKAQVVKKEVKVKKHRHSSTPLADLVLFPHFGS